MEIEDHEARRKTFDLAAQDYEAARPGYPEAAIAELVTATGLKPGSKCLEIGVGTGQATRDIAPMGCTITGLEPGSNLAQVAEAVLKPFPAVQIVQSTFENFRAPISSFDLLYSATAFHWTDPELRWDKTASLLKPGGHIALLTNKSMEGELHTDFHEASQSIYASYVREPSEQSRSISLENITLAIAEALHLELEDDPRFEVIISQSFSFNLELTAAQVCQLQMTFSDHLLLDENIRSAIHEELKVLIDREFGGRVTKPYETALVVARRA